MTLPELLISVVLTGVLIASLTMAITVIYKQADNTTGRTNNARSEQNVNVWMPADLSSAESVSTDPAATPCTGTCPAGANVGGTNALMLTWTGTVPGAGGVAVITTTKVSYRYVLVGLEYQMIRVECTTTGGGSATCETNVVLHDLDPPPIGVDYVVGATKPTWIMVVSQALDPGDTSGQTPAPVDDPTFKSKNGQRVVVTINGGGDVAGSGGGTNQISLSAGGTDRQTSLATNSVSFNQSLTAARTRCGGNFGMVIDISGSINQADPTNMTTVRAAITSMIDTFAGTPVKLELTKFGWLGSVLGAGATGARYFDMLKETDVSDLKVYVNGGTTSTGQTVSKIDSVNDATNWEDGLYRAFRNSDGTIQASLPSKLIFFTDGVPNYDRLGGVSGQPGSTALPAGVSFPDDTALAQPTGGSYAQRAWNRANRVAREFGVQVDFIGVFVGSDTTASSSWVDVNAGYHLKDWLKWYHDVWEKGYHDDYQRANNVVYEQGYHLDYQRANNVVYQQGYHLDYQRANNVVFQIAQTGVVYEQFKSGSWSSESLSNYLNKNTTPDSTDNHRIRITGALGSWTTLTSAQYDASNVASGSADAVQTIVSAAAQTPWTSITLADYNLSNTTAADGTDGFQIANSFTTPFTLWQNTTQTAYNAGNTNNTATDGWKTILSAASQTPWTAITSTEYTNSNTTASDGTDGYQALTNLTSPYTLWQSTTQSAYDAANVDSTSTDGWRTNLSGASATPYTSITQATYTKSNTTTDSTDGYRITPSYTSPYSQWEASTQSAYNAGQPGNPSGWRTYRSYTAPFSSSEVTTEANYVAGKSATIDPTVNSDGWTATKVYVAPYTAYDAKHTYSKTNRQILGDLIDPSGIVAPLKDASGNVINAEVANMYTTTAWVDIKDALASIALAQCGGTVTLQTRVNGTTPANDTFTYNNTLDNTKVETSGSKRSGTFDFAIPSGGSITAEIQQQRTTTVVDHYTPAGWTCKAGGVPVTPTIVDVPGTPWDTIRLNVAANQAVSCIQNVTFTP
ncbi:MAG TPA: vWA domain-containing protein [Ilumatobacteraceae bacterium]